MAWPGIRVVGFEKKRRVLTPIHGPLCEQTVVPKGIAIQRANRQRTTLFGQVGARLIQQGLGSAVLMRGIMPNQPQPFSAISWHVLPPERAARHRLPICA